MIDITSYLNQTATVYSDAGFDLYGTPSYTTGTDINVRVVVKKETVKLNDGQELSIDATMWTEPTLEIDTDRVIGYFGQKYRVLDKEELVDINGVVNHKKLLLVLIQNGDEPTDQGHQHQNQHGE